MILKSLSIYKYKQKLIFVPDRKYKYGHRISQSRFEVIDLECSRKEIWDFMIRGINLFEEVDYKYDRDSEESKGFNQKLRKSVKAKSHKEFWVNSAIGKIFKEKENFIIYVLNRAKDFKGYQGYYLEPENYSLTDKSMIDKLLTALSEAS